jgi:hypothetical protein
VSLSRHFQPPLPAILKKLLAMMSFRFNAENDFSVKEANDHG